MHERDLNEIFEALVKLGTNQQTLANNLEAWRLDSSGDVSIVSNRLENMERTLQDALTPPTVRIVEERHTVHAAGAGEQHGLQALAVRNRAGAALELARGHVGTARVDALAAPDRENARGG